ncbi:hypothetical protein [Bacillus sp. V3B]|nr:hypothetical protein [Bacillus sp. V3B]
MANEQNEQLDAEWLQLVEELMESEVSKTDFRAFIELKRIEKENK